MKKNKIAIIGLGYVGLPLARLFATKYSVVGFDINTERIAELMSGVDSTLEVDSETLQSVLVNENADSIGLFCTNELDKIKDCNYYITTVQLIIHYIIHYNIPYVLCVLGYYKVVYYIT